AEVSWPAKAPIPAECGARIGGAHRRIRLAPFLADGILPAFSRNPEGCRMNPRALLATAVALGVATAAAAEQPGTVQFRLRDFAPRPPRGGRLPPLSLSSRRPSSTD